MEEFRSPALSCILPRSLISGDAGAFGEPEEELGIAEVFGSEKVPCGGAFGASCEGSGVGAVTLTGSGTGTCAGAAGSSGIDETFVGLGGGSPGSGFGGFGRGEPLGGLKGGGEVELCDGVVRRRGEVGEGGGSGSAKGIEWPSMEMSGVSSAICNAANHEETS